MRAGLLTRAVVKQTRSVGNSFISCCEQTIGIAAEVCCSIADWAVAEYIPVCAIWGPSKNLRNTGGCSQAALAMVYANVHLLLG